MAKIDKRTKELQDKLRKPITILFAFGCLLAIIYLYYFNGLSVLIRVILAFIILIITGTVISSTNNLENLGGAIYMVRSQRGINFIDNVSKHNLAFWKALVEWGAVISFGFLSYVIFRKNISRKTFALGLISIAILTLVILPNTLLLFKFLDVPIPILSSLSSVSTLQLPTPLFPYILFLIASIIGGFLLFMLAYLAIFGFYLLYTILVSVAGVLSGVPHATAALSQQVPGVIPILPGITLPLVSGILALAVVLVFHEFSHGVLSRISKIKLKSVGILPFGIFPIGAFVEPDEKQLTKINKDAQNDIFIAGVSANFLLSFILFAFTALMLLYVMPAFFKSGVSVAATAPGYPAYNVVVPGSIVESWNGHIITNESSIISASGNHTPFATVNLVTNHGNYTFKTNSTGLIGIDIIQVQLARHQGLQNGVINFIYAFLVIAFTLNFFVGIVNVLPLPFFDGWRIYKNRIKNKRNLHLLGWFVGLLLIILVLPWLFIL